MATGTPRNPRRATPETAGAGQVELSYPGKRQLADILETPPGVLRTVVPSPQNKRIYFAENLAALAKIADEAQICGKVLVLSF